MTQAERRELNAERYRGLAEAAGQLRDSTNLEQVRARQAHAALVWTALADREDEHGVAMQVFLGKPKPDTSEGR